MGEGVEVGMCPEAHRVISPQNDGVHLAICFVDVVVVVVVVDLHSSQW